MADRLVRSLFKRARPVMARPASRRLPLSLCPPSAEFQRKPLLRHRALEWAVTLRTMSTHMGSKLFHPTLVLSLGGCRPRAAARTDRI